MGDRTPGILGNDPRDNGTRTGDVALPEEGFGVPGPIGLDADSGTPPPGHLQLNNWPRTITWDEFRDIDSRPSGIDEDAQIHSEGEPPERVSVQRRHGRFRVTSLTIALSVDRSDSWVVRSQKTDALLSHEQGHYDITGLVARDMGKAILAARARTVEALEKEVKHIMERYQRRAQALSDQYDHETDHSRNREGQRRWDQRIHRSMRDGTPFSAP